MCVLEGENGVERVKNESDVWSGLAFTAWFSFTSADPRQNKPTF